MTTDDRPMFDKAYVRELVHAPKDIEYAGKLADIAEVARDALLNGTASDTDYQQLESLAAGAWAVRPLWASHVAVLKMLTVGCKRRNIYTQNIQGAGPVEIENMLEMAVVQRDKSLAAAAIQQIDRLRKTVRDQIRVDKNQVAAFLVGGQVNTMLGYLDRILRAHDAVVDHMNDKLEESSDAR